MYVCKCYEGGYKILEKNATSFVDSTLPVGLNPILIWINFFSTEYFVKFSDFIDKNIIQISTPLHHFHIPMFLCFLVLTRQEFQ